MTNPITDTSEGPVTDSDDDLLLIAYMRGAADAKSDARAERDALQATVKEMREALEAFVKYDSDADPSSVDFMLLYDKALTMAKEAVAKHKEQDHD